MNREIDNQINERCGDWYNRGEIEIHKSKYEVILVYLLWSFTFNLFSSSLWLMRHSEVNPPTLLAKEDKAWFRATFSFILKMAVFSKEKLSQPKQTIQENCWGKGSLKCFSKHLWSHKADTNARVGRTGENRSIKAGRGQA